MNYRNIGGLFIAFAALVAAGCNFRPQVDITQYFGKSEEDIRDLLGEPSGISEKPLAAKLRKIDMSNLRVNPYHLEKKFAYRQEVTPLPKPLTRLELTFSGLGRRCRYLHGMTTPFDTPDEMLRGLSLEDLEKEIVRHNEFLITYRIPSLGLVDVHCAPGTDGTYTSFSVSREEEAYFEPK